MAHPPNVLPWQIHGSWTPSHVQGFQDPLPSLLDGGPWARGCCGRYALIDEVTSAATRRREGP
ncbi:hypothetical protein ACWDT5_07390 [Rhodococcus aetherivorans]|uniref:hypothetical protein n=1 Tax=Rhodococcus sp. DMU1 TaxID=2722825 RepID=UPI00143EF112|nr:hypothetical protein [Rhodococcus sp. DMU1]QIX52254.1 hypothetical protein HFP48_23810 [Rhodococcus sp. DMU1]